MDDYGSPALCVQEENRLFLHPKTDRPQDQLLQSVIWETVADVTIGAVDLKPLAQRVLYAILRAGVCVYGETVMNASTIAERVNASVKRVREAYRDLERAGLITRVLRVARRNSVQRAYNLANRWRLGPTLVALVRTRLEAIRERSGSAAKAVRSLASSVTSGRRKQPEKPAESPDLFGGSPLPPDRGRYLSENDSNPNPDPVEPEPQQEPVDQTGQPPAAEAAPDADEGTEPAEGHETDETSETPSKGLGAGAREPDRAEPLAAEPAKPATEQAVTPPGEILREIRREVRQQGPKPVSVTVLTQAMRERAKAIAPHGWFRRQEQAGFAPYPIRPGVHDHELARDLDDPVFDAWKIHWTERGLDWRRLLGLDGPPPSGPGDGQHEPTPERRDEAAPERSDEAAPKPAATAEGDADLRMTEAEAKRARKLAPDGWRDRDGAPYPIRLPDHASERRYSLDDARFDAWKVARPNWRLFVGLLEPASSEKNAGRKKK